MEEPEEALLPAPIRPVARFELIAATSFLDRAARRELDAKALHDWFERHLVRRSLIQRPTAINEPPLGVVAIEARSPDGFVDAPLIAAIVDAAAGRALATLRAFTGLSQNDRFLTAAIHAGRVVRVSRAGETSWQARLGIGDRLSDVVLALFSVDMLTRRDEYDRAFWLCERCGKISLDARLRSTRLCDEHAEPALEGL